MATITGRIYITAQDQGEFSSLVDSATTDPSYDLVSSNEQDLTLVVDLVNA